MPQSLGTKLGAGVVKVALLLYKKLHKSFLILNDNTFLCLGWS